MCLDCFERFGVEKPIVNEKVTQAVKLIDKVYDFSSVGGNLHIQLDDWNIEDNFFNEFTPFDKEVSPEQDLAERVCFMWLKDMTEKERASALAIYWYEM